VILRKAALTLPIEGARGYLEAVLAPLMRVTVTESLFHRALDVQSRWRFGFYDSLVVAGALAAGCRTLLSEDLQHGQKLDSLRVIDPFR
jgi:predicted nucleic acid-binding protein